MKIAHVLSWYIPELGYEENCLPAEEALAGNEVAVVASARTPDYLMEFDQLFDPLGSRAARPGVESDGAISVHRLRSTPSVHGQALLFGLGRTLQDMHPDVVHAHGAFAPSTIQCILLQKRLGFSLVVDDHSHIANLRLDRGYKQAYARLIRVVYTIAGHSVSSLMPINKSAELLLSRLLDLRKIRVEPTHLGADSRTFRPSVEQRARWRSSHGIGSDDVVILSTGKFHRGKDIHVLIEAFERISGTDPGAQLVLAGEGPDQYMKELHASAERLLELRRVHFLPFVSHKNLPEWYNGADIGVWPGDPTITVLEAMAAGLPSVLPDGDPAYARFMETGSCASFTRGSGTCLAGRLADLIADPSLRQRLGARARDVVVREFSWEVIAARTLEIYERAIAG